MSSEERAAIEKRFQGHKCWLDFDSDELLDRRGLEGFFTKEEFLALYKGNGFQQQDGHPYATVKIQPIKVLKKICDSCPLSMKMTLEHGMKEYCPLEDQFSLGQYFSWSIPLQGRIACYAARM